MLVPGFWAGGPAGLAEFGRDTVASLDLSALEFLDDLSDRPVRRGAADRDPADVRIAAINLERMPFLQAVVLADRNLNEVFVAYFKHHAFHLRRNVRNQGVARQ